MWQTPPGPEREPIAPLRLPFPPSPEPDPQGGEGEGKRREASPVGGGGAVAGPAPSHTETPPMSDPHIIPAPPETRAAVADLVARYRFNADHYSGPDYNEAQARIEFIDPFFEALGWDLANKAGDSERFKDVVNEASLRIGGAMKAPDYCFRVGGQPMFYLEAKKPSVNVKDGAQPAFQLRRYGWNAKLALSVLTDFEELAIYDCRHKPGPTDPSATARVAFYTYDQYLDKLDEIYSILSKEAVRKGSFDRYALDTRKHKGTTEVDDEILREISQWREDLARDIARGNPTLSVHDLNHAVQATIDRILFLRIAEDRGVEAYGLLRDLANLTAASGSPSPRVERGSGGIRAKIGL